MLIEVRVGPGKQKLTSSILDVQRTCRLPAAKIHRVPHITLYGDFAARRGQVEQVKDAIKRIGGEYPFLPYTIDGCKWVTGRKGKVVYFNVVASEELKAFRRELAEHLLQVVPSTKSYDSEQDFLFHATLAYRLSDTEFRRTWSYVSGQTPMLKRILSRLAGSEGHIMRYSYLPMHALRVTLLNDQSRIICEYDLLQKKLLSRQEALSRSEWQRTLRLFRVRRGMQNCHDHGRATYVISDLHLDHRNIIRYCARPFSFSDVKEMNDVLVDNWNNTVRDNPVYFLGDLCFGRGTRPVDYWLRRLRGQVHFVRGCHDTEVAHSKACEVLAHGDYRFLLVHDPDQVPIPWDGWIIHGHKHDNYVKNYPFVNGERKTINVSAELVNYRPVSLDYLVSLGLDSIRRMDTVDSEPERK